MGPSGDNSTASSISTPDVTGAVAGQKSAADTLFGNQNIDWGNYLAGFYNSKNKVYLKQLNPAFMLDN